MTDRLADTMGIENDEAEELARVREELRRAREDLEVFSQLTSGYWWSGTRSGGSLAVRAWSTRGFTRATGHERDWLQGWVQRAIEGSANNGDLHAEDLESFAQVVASLFRGRDEGGLEHAVHEFRLFARDGSMTWIRQRLQGQGAGDARRVYASGELVTERKRTEEALGHVEARFLSLVE